MVTSRPHCLYIQNDCIPVYAGVTLHGNLKPSALECASIKTSLKDLTVASYLLEAVSKKRYWWVFNFDVACVVCVKYGIGADLTAERLVLNSAGKAVNCSCFVRNVM
jgi:hypothetical protein